MNSTFSVAVLSGKGGVGKTNLSPNLACAPYQFHLGRVDGEWRWVEFAADGEG